MPDTTTHNGGPLPPPGPPGPSGAPTPWADPAPFAPAPRVDRRPRPGQLTTAWHALVMITWVGVSLAYMAVWKASEELGIATWWLGPRSNPQPLVIRLVPFWLAAVFAILAGFNVRRLPLIGLVGAALLAAIAVPDLSRSTGLAIVEFAIAAAVLLVSAAAFTGMYRRPSPDVAG